MAQPHLVHAGDAGRRRCPGAEVLPAHPASKQRKAPAREKDPESGWFIDQRDWAALDELDPVLPIAERILRETSGPGAPWTIVESTDDRYRDLTVARTILAALTARLEQKPTIGPSLASSVFGDVETQATVLSRVDLDQSLRQADVPSAAGQGERLVAASCRWRPVGAESALCSRSKAGTPVARVGSSAA